MCGKTLLEVTLAVIKPHIVKRPSDLRAIREIIVNENFKVIKTCQKFCRPQDLDRLFPDRHNQSHYSRFVSSMLCGPCDFYVLARENAIGYWLQILGPDRVHEAKITDPKSIRSRFGVSDTLNAAEGSLSTANARHEIESVFGTDFSLDEWYRNDESRFRLDVYDMKLNKKSFFHYF